MCVIMRVTEPATAPSGLSWAGFSTYSLTLTLWVCMCLCVSLSPLRPFLLRALRRPAYGRTVAVACGASPADGGWFWLPLQIKTAGSLRFETQTVSQCGLWPCGTMGKARGGAKEKRPRRQQGEAARIRFRFAWPACTRGSPLRACASFC